MDDASSPPMELQENPDGAFKSAIDILLQWESIGLNFANPMDAASPPMELQGIADGAFKSAVEIILQWESRGARKEHLFGGDRQEIDEYLQAVYEIQRSTSSSISEDQSRANNFMDIAMARLTEEFHVILISPKISVGTHWLTSTSSLYSSTSLSTIVSELQDDPQLNIESIHDLRTIAEMMSSAGYLHLGIQVYVNDWKSFMETCFRRLGFEHVGDAKRLGSLSLAHKIRQWMEAANCFRILFVREKQLREQIFEGFSDETRFMEMFKDHAIMLLNFAQVVSSVSSRSPEKLFPILDVYNTLSEFLPDIYAALESIRIQGAETLFQVAEAARRMLSEFENAVLHELLNVPVPPGLIHSLTEYVMNCMIRMASTYRKTLVELIVSKPSMGSHYSGETMISDMESVELNRHTPLEIHFIWITVVLRFNLEGKSKGYENASLAHLFMMNNVYYIVQKIKGSTELRELIGDYFLEKIIQRVQHEESNYLTSTWDRVLYPLEFKALQARWRGLYPMEWISTYFTEYTAKHSLLIFHAMFERAHETQAKWLVLDLQLREELHLSILKKLIPIYRSFMDQLHERYGKRFEKYIKYSVEDLETVVSDFFKGHPVSKQLRTSQSKWWKCGIIP